MADILRRDIILDGCTMFHLRQRERHYLSITGGSHGLDGSPDIIMRFLSFDEDQASAMYVASMMAINVAAKKLEPLQ